MTENQQEPIVVVIETPTLTTKQQLTSAAIQLGTAIAVPVLLVGAFAASSGVSAVKSKIKARKLRKNPTLTVVPDPVED